MNISFSVIIPVYNRPDELEELLESLSIQTYKTDYEIVIVEDGSSKPSEHLVKQFSGSLDISYYFKENTGPGDSRNFGMRKARGNYFIFVDSDCILPPQYLEEVAGALKKHPADCFGGPDTAHRSFSPIQKAINHAMTSFMTTGGIRGSKKPVNAFQPRSFNMGISKKAFQATGGFGRIHPGEDPDLSIRLVNDGFKILYINNAFVYHKRRISWKKFYRQVYKFGKARAILNKRYPETRRITYWFPGLFWGGLLLAVVLLFFYIGILFYVYALFIFAVFMEALIKNKNVGIAFMAVYAMLIQFFAYGKGFLTATFFIVFLNKKPEIAFPNMFFKDKV